MGQKVLDPRLRGIAARRSGTQAGRPARRAGFTRNSSLRARFTRGARHRPVSSRSDLGKPCQGNLRSALSHMSSLAQDLHFLPGPPTIRNRNRPAKQVGSQCWMNQHSLNRGSTRQSVLCAVSASPECLMNRGEPHRLRTGSPAHYSRPRGPAFYPPFFLPFAGPAANYPWRTR
jgi:hypothetical protein